MQSRKISREEKRKGVSKEKPKGGKNLSTTAKEKNGGEKG